MDLIALWALIMAWSSGIIDSCVSPHNEISKGYTGGLPHEYERHFL